MKKQSGSLEMSKTVITEPGVVCFCSCSARELVCLQTG